MGALRVQGPPVSLYEAQSRNSNRSFMQQHKSCVSSLAYTNIAVDLSKTIRHA